MAQVCFYVRCSDCVGLCGNVCCVVGAVKDSGICVGDVMDVEFSV